MAQPTTPASPPRVFVLGATGLLGRLAVAALVRRGARATCLVRSAARARAVPELARDVELVEGAVDDADALARCVAACPDGVLVCLGHVYGEPSTSRFMTAAVSKLLPAMRAAAVTRLVDVSGVVNAQPGDSSGAWYGFMRLWLSATKPSVLADHEGKTRAIEAAATEWPGLEWTIARPPLLTNSAASGCRAVAAVDASCSASVSRADVAAFMVDELFARRWVRKAPVVCA